ncbi:MAG TPA: glycosyltransferase family 2 protein [Flavobacteriaceae bacterium]|nr:glycosyltransferase family 2 protein [Flavobacteriaceae bacterium]
MQHQGQNEISVVIPVYNEQENIPILYERLCKTLSAISLKFEILFVNDGSQDASQKRILELAEKDERVRYLELSRNFGHQIAVSAGLQFSNAQATVIMDADLQDPPELITELYTTYKQGFDVVYAKRQNREGETLLKKFTAKLFYRLMKRLSSVEIPLDTGDFRLIDKKVVNALNHMPEKNKFLRGQMAWLGFKHSFVEYDRPARAHGKSGYTYGKMFRLAFDAITGFSDKPLLFVSRLGLVMSLVSFLIILYAIFAYFVLEQTITGWTSLIITSTFIGGIQLLSIGIIGEYISRISANTQNRPLFIVSDTNIDNVKTNSHL